MIGRFGLECLHIVAIHYTEPIGVLRLNKFFLLSNILGFQEKKIVARTDGCISSYIIYLY
jgi:hypothetical protein